MGLSLRRSITVLAWALAFALPSTQVTAEDVPARPSAAGRSWTLLLPQDNQLVFRGVVNLDGAGMGSGSMMYPAPNAAGFLAALITHGILLESTKNSQKQKLQEEADKVLLPYQEVLRDFDMTDLLQRALQKSQLGPDSTLQPEASATMSDWMIGVIPVYAMTQDERALILDAAVSLRGRHATAAAYQGVIRVVSSPREEVELPAHWTAERGKALKDEAAAMLAHALDIATQLGMEAPPPDVAKQRTFRYRAGTKDRYERAELLRDECDRLVVRNLRGALMSIPFKRDTEVPCAAGQSLSSEAPSRP